MIQCFNNRILWAGGYSLPGRKRNAEKKIIAIHHRFSLLLGITLGYPIFIKEKSCGGKGGALDLETQAFHIITEVFSERRRIHVIWLYGIGSVPLSLKIQGIGWT